MSNSISPMYLMNLISTIEKSLWDKFESNKYKNVRYYIEKWQNTTIDSRGNSHHDFYISENQQGNIDLLETLNRIEGETLLKIAINLGLETPDFIPAIPTFRNEIKSDYQTASATFEKAFKQIEEHPDIAIGLANSALESIIKQILQDGKVKAKFNPNKTLYDLTAELLKEFQLYPTTDMPTEIRTIGSSLLSINQSIEKLRSDKTSMHGKTQDDYIVKDPLYTYFIVNSVATIGLFLNSFYKKKIVQIQASQTCITNDVLPF